MMDLKKSLRCVFICYQLYCNVGEMTSLSCVICPGWNQSLCRHRSDPRAQIQVHAITKKKNLFLFSLHVLVFLQTALAAWNVLLMWSDSWQAGAGQGVCVLLSHDRMSTDPNRLGGSLRRALTKHVELAWSRCWLQTQISLKNKQICACETE